MRSVTLASLSMTLSALAIASPALAQQAAPPAMTQPAQTPPPRPAQAAQGGDARPPQIAVPLERRSALPQGFSVVLVLGDIQGAATSDDVPPAARKALVDMRDFLPFKSYKLLDAAWLMCCGQDPRAGQAARGVTSTSGSPTAVTQLLRGPEDQEYELKLYTSPAPGAQVFVRFALFGSAASREGEVTGATSLSSTRTIQRRIADLSDQRGLYEKQILEARKKADVGVAPATEVSKLEVEVRRIDREIADLRARLEEGPAGRPAVRASVQHMAHGPMIDTSFAMNVGETVVVGTSRLKGGSRALIALLTAVPPRTTERRE